MLGGIQAPLEFSRIVHVFGSNLTTLKIETVMITVPMDVIEIVVLIWLNCKLLTLEFAPIIIDVPKSNAFQD